MELQKYIDELEKITPIEFKSEILKSIKEIISESNYENYQSLIADLGNPQEFMNQYLQSREVEIKPIPSKFKSKKLENTSTRIDSMFHYLKQRLSRKRIRYTIYSALSIILIYFLFVASLPLLVDTKYTRLYTSDRFGNDGIIDAVFDDEGRTYILFNNEDLVQISENGNIDIIEMPFLGHSESIYQLYTLKSGVAAILYFELLNEIVLKKFNYDPTLQIWEEDILPKNSEIRNCNDMDVCERLVIGSSNGIFTGIYVSTDETNNELWNVNYINSGGIHTEIINQTELSLQANLKLNMTQIISGIYSDEGLELLFRSDSYIQYFAYNEFFNVTYPINEDELAYYWARDLDTGEFNTYNYTYIRMPNGGFDTSIINMNITFYDSITAKLFLHTNQTYLLISNGGVGNDFLYKNQIYTIDESQLILLGKSESTITDASEGSATNHRIRTVPAIIDNQIQFYYISGNQDIYLDDMIKEPINLDLPKSRGWSYLSSFNENTGSRSKASALLNIRDKNGWTNNILYLGEDDYGAFSKTFLELKTWSAILIEGSIPVNNPPTKSGNQFKSIIFVTISGIGIIIFRKSRMLTRFKIKQI